MAGSCPFIVCHCVSIYIIYYTHHLCVCKRGEDADFYTHLQEHSGLSFHYTVYIYICVCTNPLYSLHPNLKEPLPLTMTLRPTPEIHISILSGVILRKGRSQRYIIRGRTQEPPPRGDRQDGGSQQGNTGSPKSVLEHN